MSEPTVDLARRMPHPWSRDPAAQSAVRAAEDAAADGRTPPPDHRELPAAVAELRERVGRLEAFTKSCICRETEIEVCAVNPAADSAGSDGDGLRDVRDSRTATDGLRTERVTLEITQRAESYAPCRDLDWQRMLRQTPGGLFPGESVRVVEETHFDDLAQVVMERDAAIRERDAINAKVTDLERERDEFRECANGRAECLAKVMREREEAERERNKLKARVAELEAAAKLAPAANAGGVSAAGEVSGDGKSGSEETQPPRGWLTKEDGEALCLACAVLHGVFVGSWREKHDAAKRLEAIRWQAVREAGGEVSQ